jgi:hypothetical protein
MRPTTVNQFATKRSLKVIEAHALTNNPIPGTIHQGIWVPARRACSSKTSGSLLGGGSNLESARQQIRDELRPVKQLDRCFSQSQRIAYH